MQNETEMTGAPVIRAPLHPFRVIPGGATAVPDEWYAAGVLVVALAALWMIRRNLGNNADHVHVGGSATMVGLFYFLIFTAVVRIGITFASRGGERDTPATRGLAFYA